MPQPKVHKYKHDKRLALAKVWIKTYSGKKLYHGYAKHFGVNKLCAILELEMLGYEFSAELKESIKMAEKDKQVKRERQKAKLEENLIESDENFAYIAGYTSGGAPYGVTWEEKVEMLQLEKEYNPRYQLIDFEDELPF
jgi:hypothetical protein